MHIIKKPLSSSLAEKVSFMRRAFFPFGSLSAHYKYGDENVQINCYAF
jgi:hypothetical protein